MIEQPLNITEDDAAGILREVIGGWCDTEKTAGSQPVLVAQKLLDVMVGVLVENMGGGAVRQAMLTIVELTYPEPTSVFERQALKEMIDALSQARRSVEGKPSIIMPPTKLDS